MNRKNLKEENDILEALDRLSDKCREIIKGSDAAAIVGIRTRGLYLAERIFEILKSEHHQNLFFGTLDITLYRDDLSSMGAQPIVGMTDLPFPIDGCTIILVDDVLFTGRTTRAAIDALIAFGRPAAIRLLVLVDRGHREYPIHADYCAFNIETTKNQIVEVRLTETDGRDASDLVTLDVEAGS